MKKIFIFLILVFLCSCKFNNQNQKNDEEPSYTPDILWTLETDAYWNEFQTQEDKYLYFQQSKNDGTNIAKVDLSTGKYVWESDCFPTYCSYSICVLENYICLLDKESNLLFFDKYTGKFLTKVFFTENDTEKIFSEPTGNTLTYYKNCIYYGRRSKDGDKSYRGIMCLPVEVINFNIKEQIVEPNFILPVQEGCFINKFLIENDILYSVTMNHNYPESGSVYCISFDLKNNKVLWKTEIESFYGYGFNSLVMTESKIFLFDCGICALNKDNGEIVFYKNQSWEDLQHEVHLSTNVYSTGIFQWNNKFYYTRNAYVGSNEKMGRSEKLNKNIICFDGNKYKLIWADLPPYENGTSLRTRPVIVNEKCFVVTNTGLRVYDANKGKLIGVWKDIYNLGYDMNASYNNSFIFFNHDLNSGKGVLTAINVS